VALAPSLTGRIITVNDALRTTAGRKQSRAGRQLGLPAAPAPPGDPLRPDPDPAPPEPAPPAPPPRQGRVPAGPRQPAPAPADFIGALIRSSRRYS
jgi:hypothetical protein